MVKLMVAHAFVRACARAWLIDMVKKIRAGEASPPVKVSRRNRFNNFEGRGYDYAALERLELEQLKAGVTAPDPVELD